MTSGGSRGFLLVAMGAALWGTAGIAGAFAARYSSLSWPAISSVRLLLGGLLMLVLTAITGELRRVQRTAESVRRIVATGVATAIYATAYFQSLPLVGVAVATVVCLGAAPMAVAVYTAIRERRMPSRPTMLALLAALTGLVLVSNPSTPTGDHRGFALGFALALLSGLAFAASTVVNQRTVPGLTPRPLIATSLTLAGLLSAPLGMLGGADFTTVTAPAWAAIAFLVIFQTMVAYLAYFGGLQAGLPATTAVIVLLIEPLTATVLAVLVLHEQLTLPVLLGMVLLMLAVVLVSPVRRNRAGRRSRAGRRNQARSVSRARRTAREKSG